MRSGPGERALSRCDTCGDRRQQGRAKHAPRVSLQTPAQAFSARAQTPGGYALAPMRALSIHIAGLVVIEPTVHGDERGFFCETYRRRWHAQAGIPKDQQFVQDNHSRSRRGVLRGMHFQVGKGVAKLVRCARGRIIDVAVDLRRGSPTYGRWEAVELDGESMRELYVPIGFAHGFCVLSDVADVLYKQSAYHDPELERGIAWNDPELAIAWPLPAAQLIVSDRDAAAPRLSEIADELPFRWHP